LLGEFLTAAVVEVQPVGFGGSGEHFGAVVNFGLQQEHALEAGFERCEDHFLFFFAELLEFFFEFFGGFLEFFGGLVFVFQGFFALLLAEGFEGFFHLFLAALELFAAGSCGGRLGLLVLGLFCPDLPVFPDFPDSSDLED
jgi:hypothetical protein